MSKDGSGSKSAESFLRHLLWIIPFITIAFIAALVVTMPNIIRTVATDKLKEMGATQVSIGEVSINPISGDVTVENIRIVGNKGLKLLANRLFVSVIPSGLLSKHIVVRSLQLNGLKADVKRMADGAMIIGGMTMPTAAAEAKDKPSGWVVNLISLEITESDVAVDNEKVSMQLTLDRVSVGKVSTSKINKPTPISATGSINGSPLSLNASIKPLSINQEINGNIKLDRLKLVDYATMVPSEISDLKGNLSIDSKIHVVIDHSSSITLNHDGNVVLNAFGAKYGDYLMSLGKMDWVGELLAVIDLQTFSYEIKQVGKTSVEKVSANLGWKNSVVVDIGKLDWSGSISAGADHPFSLTGDASIVGLATTMTGKNAPKIDLGAVTVANLDVTGKEYVKAETIEFEKVAVGSVSGDNKTLTISSSILKDIDVRALRDVSLDSVLLDGLVANLDRTKSGKLTLPQAGVTAGEDTQTKSKPPVIHIGSIIFEGKSSVTISDESVTPVFNETVNIKVARLKNINSAKPKKPSSFILSLGNDDYASIAASGDITPFSYQTHAKIKGRINSLDLPPLTPYIEKQLGFAISSGHLNDTFALTVKDGKLDGKFKLGLINFKLEPRDAEKMKGLTSSLSMPLETALSTLRDDKGDIHLYVPISGDVNAPQFSLAGAINKALGSAMGSATLTYLALAFQPYGALIALADVAGDVLRRVKLNPIIFEPQSAELDRDAIKYMEKLGGIMNDKPELRVRVYGVANKADNELMQEFLRHELEKSAGGESKKANVDSVDKPTSDDPDLNQKLLELADERARAVKNHLVNEYGVDPDRLFIGLPKLDTSEKSKSMAQLLI